MTPRAKLHNLNIIDPKNFKLIGTITLPGKHSEAMAIDQAGQKMYVNLSTAVAVGVVDLEDPQINCAMAYSGRGSPQFHGAR